MELKTRVRFWQAAVQFFEPLASEQPPDKSAFLSLAEKIAAAPCKLVGDGRLETTVIVLVMLDTLGATRNSERHTTRAEWWLSPPRYWDRSRGNNPFYKNNRYNQEAKLMKRKGNGVRTDEEEHCKNHTELQLHPAVPQLGRSEFAT